MVSESLFTNHVNGYNVSYKESDISAFLGLSRGEAGMSSSLWDKVVALIASVTCACARAHDRFSKVSHKTSDISVDGGSL